MDKIKPYLLKLKQYHFWILILVAVAALFYAWSVGTAELESSFKKNKSSIARQFSELQNKSKSRGGGNFPNDKWIKKRRELTEKLTANGKVAMKNIRDIQNKAQIWPQTLHPKSQAEIDENRWTDQTVGDYVFAAEEEIERFRVILNAAEGPEDAGIFWDETDFNNLKQSANDKEIKAEKDCKMFQQILWVYEALLTAIAQTNDGVEDRFNLPIYAIKDTAIFQEASENIEEEAWLVREDAPVVKEKDSKKRTSRTPKRGGGSKKSPDKFQPQLRTMIGKAISLDGYNVIAFRIKLRMQIDFLESFLRSLANAPIPMILEGVRFIHKPSLKVVKSIKPDSGSRRRISNNKKTEDQEKKGLPETTEETDERGSLIEIWGFAYLAKGISSVPLNDETAGFKSEQENLTVAK